LKERGEWVMEEGLRPLFAGYSPFIFLFSGGVDSHHQFSLVKRGRRTSLPNSRPIPKPKAIYAVNTNIIPASTRSFCINVIAKPYIMRKMAKWLTHILPMCSVTVTSHRGLNLRELKDSTAVSTNATPNVISDVLSHPMARKDKLIRPTPKPR